MQSLRNEISDIYKLNSISNLSKGKFKNMSMEDFSKISQLQNLIEEKRS